MYQEAVRTGAHANMMKLGFSSAEATCLRAYLSAPISRAIGKAIEERDGRFAAFTHEGYNIMARSAKQAAQMSASGREQGIAPRLFKQLKGFGYGEPASHLGVRFARPPLCPPPPYPPHLTPVHRLPFPSTHLHASLSCSSSICTPSRPR